MSFTITDAKTLAETWFEEYLDNADILVWTNEFVRRIVSNKLWLRETEQYSNAVANTDYELPSEFFRSIKLEDSNQVECKEYVVNNGYISFPSDGTYTLTYIAYPRKMTAISGSAGTVPLPDAFEYPLVEFLIFKFYNKELDDEDNKKASMEYEQRMRASLKNIYQEMEIDSEGDSFQVKMRW